MKAIVVYFSETGNTENLAILIKNALEERNIETDSFKIKWGEGSFIWKILTSIFLREIPVEGKDLEEYNLIFLGSPVWAFSPVPAVTSFVKHTHGLKGKKVFLFFTFGSGTGRRRAERILKRVVDKAGGEVVSVLQIKSKLMKMPERVRERVNFFIETSLPCSK